LMTKFGKAKKPGLSGFQTGVSNFGNFREQPRKELKLKI
jgi:hypothetical protein